MPTYHDSQGRVRWRDYVEPRPGPGPMTARAKMLRDLVRDGSEGTRELVFRDGSCTLTLGAPVARAPRARPARAVEASVTTMALDLVGPQEIAERLGVRVQTVWMWRSRQRLPEPMGVISGVPLWHWHDIEKWAANRPSLASRRQDAAS